MEESLQREMIKMSQVHRDVVPGPPVSADLSPAVPANQRTIQPGEIEERAHHVGDFWKKTRILFSSVTIFFMK